MSIERAGARRRSRMIGLVGAGLLCSGAAAGTDDRPTSDDPDRGVAEHADLEGVGDVLALREIVGRDVGENPVGLPRPRPLAEGEACAGIVSRVVPNPESGSVDYLGCFAPGEIDRAFSPGVVSSVPTLLLPATTSTIELDAKALEDLEDRIEFDPADPAVRADPDPRDGGGMPTVGGEPVEEDDTPRLEIERR